MFLSLFFSLNLPISLSRPLATSWRTSFATVRDDLLTLRATRRRRSKSPGRVRLCNRRTSETKWRRESATARPARWLPIVGAPPLGRPKCRRKRSFSGQRKQVCLAGSERREFNCFLKEPDHIASQPAVGRLMQASAARSSRPQPDKNKCALACDSFGCNSLRKLIGHTH